MSNSQADRLAERIGFYLPDHILQALDQLTALAKQQAEVPAVAQAVPSEMPLPVALRLLARQIKENNGLRDNMERKHLLLERAADAISQVGDKVDAATPQGGQAAVQLKYDIVECDDCCGTGSVGEEVYQGEFQPPEREACSSCGGSGKWKVPAALAQGTTPAATPRDNEFERGYLKGLKHAKEMSEIKAALQEHADLGQELGEYGGLSDERIVEIWGALPYNTGPIGFARAILAEAGIKEKT